MTQDLQPFQQGGSSHFRKRPLDERMAAHVGAWMPAAVRGMLSAVYNRALQRGRGHLECRMPGGERVRVMAAHRHIAWNPDEYAAFRRDVREGDVVLDIGANLGAYTLLFAQWVGERGRVYAFEPAPDARRGLAQHVVMNDVAARVVVLREAVSGTPGTARFLATGTSGANRLTGGAEREATDVVTTSIDAFCAPLGLRPRLIKVDVEGAELDVLRGARQTIAAGGGHLRLYVEMHPGLWPAMGISREQIEAELQAQGLRAEALDGGSPSWNLEGVCLRLRPCAS